MVLLSIKPVRFAVSEAAAAVDVVREVNDHVGVDVAESEIDLLQLSTRAQPFLRRRGAPNRLLVRDPQRLRRVARFNEILWHDTPSSSDSFNRFVFGGIISASPFQ
jgi:hypothetical protein